MRLGLKLQSQTDPKNYSYEYPPFLVFLEEKINESESSWVDNQPSWCANNYSIALT
jgi:hypothetical protein